MLSRNLSKKSISVKIGQILFSDSSGLPLRATLGSCIGLTIYDPVTTFGGLAHIFLPNRDQVDNSRDQVDNKILEKSPGKYADHAVHYMVEKFSKKKIPFRRLQAKIAGGASLFPLLTSVNSVFLVGMQNVSVTEECLNKAGIRITGQDVGKDRGRVILFNLSNGAVIIKESSGGNTRII
ncbi:MAG: chemotaxis protein CheD [Candidatus Odinarchaeota archaeon]